MTRVFSRIWFIVIILIICVIGGVFVWNYFNLSKEEAKDETTDWQTYRNEEYGFEIKYPLYLNTGMASNSVLGTVDAPIGGIYLGPLVFIVADTSFLKQKAEDYFNRYYNEAIHPAIINEAPGGISCSLENFNNNLVQGVYCIGSGGPAFYALIKSNKYNIFVDGYSRGYDVQGSKMGELKEGDLNQMLSTFRFLE